MAFELEMCYINKYLLYDITQKQRRSEGGLALTGLPAVSRNIYNISVLSFLTQMLSVSNEKGSVE